MFYSSEHLATVEVLHADDDDVNPDVAVITVPQLVFFENIEAKYENKCKTNLKDMKSSSLENVTTRLLSSFGTGNKYFRMLFTCKKN